MSIQISRVIAFLLSAMVILGCSVISSPSATNPSPTDIDSAPEVEDTPNTPTFKVVHNGSPTYFADWSPDGSMIAMGGGSTNVVRTMDQDVYNLPRIEAAESSSILMVWDTSSGDLVSVLDYVAPGPIAVADGALVEWSPTDSTVLVSTGDELVVWDPTTDEVVHILEGHTAEIRDAEWSPDGTWILSGSEDGTLRLWNARTGIEQFRFDTGTLVYNVAWSPDSTQFAATYVFGIQVWNTSSQEVILEREGDEELQTLRDVLDGGELLWLNDGPRVAAEGDDGTVEIWDLASSTVAITLEAEPNVRVISVSPDRSTILTGHRFGGEGLVALWDATTGNPLASIETNEPVYGVSWSPDGSNLLISFDLGAGIWEVP